MSANLYGESERRTNILCTPSYDIIQAGMQDFRHFQQKYAVMEVRISVSRDGRSCKHTRPELSPDGYPVQANIVTIAIIARLPLLPLSSLLQVDDREVKATHGPHELSSLRPLLLQF